MGDVFATPLIAEALNRHRSACINPGDLAARSLRSRNDPKDHGHIFRWEPWVRSFLCAQSLISSLRFKVAEENGRFSVSLSSYLAPKQGGAGKEICLATLVRPQDGVFKKQIEKVLDWADLREERAPEILAQICNIYAFWGSIIPIHTDRLRATREIVDAAVQLAMFVEMRFKHEMACFRPTDLSPQVQPMITTPGHGSFPSGHCVEAYVIKEVLQALIGVNRKKPTHDAVREQFSRIAARISTNRVIAGVHFPIDNLAGRMLGLVLGRYFVFCCNDGESVDQDPAIHEGTFDGTACPDDAEFEPEKSIYEMHPDLSSFYKYVQIEGLDDFKSFDSVLAPLWKKAQAELRELQLDLRD